MDKLKMQTKDWTEENARKLMELFPNIVTESIDINGNVVRAIDKDKLEQEINATVVAGPQQRYEFTWPDKKQAQITARTPINKTLRPCREESVDFDTTENLYIEGDNLEVLKLLQETYLGKIKMIYIDPPYNTGHDFVYNDDFAQDKDGYKENSGQYDEEGNYIANGENPESNGRFHTDWLNMMYPRLRLAKNLLTDDGVIFISIDDNEVRNLKILCDEIFGEQNFVANMIWKSKPQGGNDNKNVIAEHEYIFIYCRNAGEVKINGKKNMGDKYTKEDEYVTERGKYSLSKLDLSTLEYRINLDYPIVCPDGSVVYAGNVTKAEWENRISNTDGKHRDWRWRWEKKRFEEFSKKGFVEFKKVNNTWTVYTKEYERVDNNGDNIERIIMYRTIIDKITTINGTRDVKELFDGERIFTFPKPVDLILQFCKMGLPVDSIILDFFSGSATTAHAVMQLNAEDGGKRKFIMVQLPEKCDEKSEAFKAGYKNICEIGKERIRRAGKKIVEEHPDVTFDGGFRVLKVDDTNMEDVFYTPNKVEQGDLNMFAENIKPDRTPMDLLFQVMLELGVELSSKIEVKEVKDKLIYSVNNNYLVACFDDALDDEVITAIAKLQPVYFVTRDSSIATDSVFTNFEQIFMTYSKDTIRKVL